MNINNNQNAVYGKNVTRGNTPSYATRQALARAAVDARINRNTYYDRQEAVEAVTRYIQCIYDYYGAWGNQTVLGIELTNHLANI